MALRFVLAAVASVALGASLGTLASSGLVGCAAAGSQQAAGVGGELEDAAATALDGGASDDGGGAAATGDGGGQTGPAGFDAGPPAQVGDTDAGSGGDAGECTTLAQCPYQSATNVAGVACTAGTCVITCNGESYDVNGLPADGCEVAGTCVKSQGTAVCPVDDHTEALAADAGSYSCDDSASAQNMTGAVPSDFRPHTPAIDGFVIATGAAPDYFVITATGGLTCEDDANLTLTMSGSAQPTCYILNLLTDKNGGQSCTTSTTGVCSISNGSGSYSDNSVIYASVTKSASCTAATTPDDGAFAITGHL